MKTIHANENGVVKHKRCIIQHCKVFLQDTGPWSQGKRIGTLNAPRLKRMDGIQAFWEPSHS